MHGHMNVRLEDVKILERRAAGISRVQRALDFLTRTVSSCVFPKYSNIPTVLKWPISNPYVAVLSALFSTDTKNIFSFLAIYFYPNLLTSD